MKGGKMERNHEKAAIFQFIDPQTEHFVAARKLELSVEAINRVMDPHMVTSKRQVTNSLAYRLANPCLRLEEIAQHSNQPVELLREDLQLAQETFQWAVNALGKNNI